MVWRRGEVTTTYVELRDLCLEIQQILKDAMGGHIPDDMMNSRSSDLTIDVTLDGKQLSMNSFESLERLLIEFSMSKINAIKVTMSEYLYRHYRSTINYRVSIGMDGSDYTFFMDYTDCQSDGRTGLQIQLLSDKFIENHKIKFLDTSGLTTKSKLIGPSAAVASIGIIDMARLHSSVLEVAGLTGLLVVGLGFIMATTMTVTKKRGIIYEKEQLHKHA